ncbi:MAG TPA: hypothetical protein VIT68_03155 [Candidatus Gracilibacteria bacterium]
MMTIFHLGVLGAALILIAFLLNQLHKWKDTYFVYDFFNFIGSTFLVIYAVDGKVWPFVVLNGIWALMSLRDSITDLQRNSHKRKGGFWEKWMM